ncbi:uncharacterized protein LOC134181953 [Corticium candelabrum]|uniref:uncharacterized protein LOC134181953 n=1 Tax=Corticium candelabrum TaxID=121492 RepID=UPI002E25CCFC|nr:uncharacterized protein LOC134181953 [Corticium candelabrum]
MSPTLKPSSISFDLSQPDSSTHMGKEEYDQHSRSATAKGLIATLSMILAVALVVAVALRFRRKKRLRQLREVRRHANVSGITTVIQPPDGNSTENKPYPLPAERDNCTCDNDVFLSPPSYETAISTEEERNFLQTDTFQSIHQDEDADSLPGYEAAILQVPQTTEEMALAQSETRNQITNTQEMKPASFPVS